jgi:hypothetical protein
VTPVAPEVGQRHAASFAWRRWFAAALLCAVAAPAAHPVRAGADPVPIITVRTKSLFIRDDNVEPIELKRRNFSLRVETLLDPPEDNQVVPPSPGSAGDPTSAGASGGGGLFEIYNPATGQQFTLPLPAEKWGMIGTLTTFKGYRYVGGYPDGGIFKVFVKRGKVTIRGGRHNWGYTLENPPQLRVAYRVTLGTGITWCGEAPGKYNNDPLYDTNVRFVAELKSPPPAVCPPLP